MHMTIIFAIYYSMQQILHVLHSHFLVVDNKSVIYAVIFTKFTVRIKKKKILN